MSDKKAFVVRGAGIRCTCGSQTGKLDMPSSHGSYIRDKAMMNQGDCKAGLDKNIPPFGSCSSPAKGMDKTCMPMLATEWLNVKEDTLVDGKPALTTDSMIVCGFGGIITFEDAGQGVY